MKNTLYIKFISLSVCLFLFNSCEKWIEVEEPNSKILRSQVFSSDATAISALQGIYNQLYRAGFSRGGIESVTVLSGLSADILQPMRENDFILSQFDQCQILPANEYNYDLWSSAYNIVYLTNSLLEGLQQSTQISTKVAKRLEGEVKFVRAFIYFYLVNLFGDVPLVLTTNYEVNATIKRSSTEKVYQQIIADLNASIELLEMEYMNGERTHVNHYTAVAFLARVHLFLENWSLAEEYSNEVIKHTALFELLPDLDKVFLANSREAIWQLSPITSGVGYTSTNEGNVFIINSPASSSLKLSKIFATSFKNNDKRRVHWIKYQNEAKVYYSYKYKIYNSSEIETEYSMVLRLAEQYLICAEARAHQDNLTGAIHELDKIRERAGLDLLANTNPGISKETLLQKIAIARKRELFTEWGHRWFDLKRTGKAGVILSSQGSTWEATDKLYPIPEEELLSNPNLTQNPGY